MLRSQVQVLLVALGLSVLLVRVSTAPYRDMLAETMRADLTNDKDLTHWLLLKFMAELRARGDETMRGRAGVMRRHLPLSQRERKAGCRNFFWKTFTSC
ncbi:somatostatin-1 [Archocentrus centrarchus]|uniref:somatostatin-1 n=1 Tax=Archocentrus centrarchus TaxID=63155 RepID=UPI0011E9F10B|nr:somatostatin-1-like [Archocentrus centrarchus]